MKPKQIRFITSKYVDLFKINDGDSVTVTHTDGRVVTKPCKFIDETHFYFGVTCYHICEFAELVEKSNAVVTPTIKEEDQ